MASDQVRPHFSSFHAQAERELLQLILQSEASYPWNPADPGAEAYFAELEQEVAASWSSAELAAQGQALSSQLEQLWATVLPTATIQETAAQSLSADLFGQFAAQVPKSLLDKIVGRANQIIATNLSLADQLVQCVQELLPEWGEDDLQVLARPFAYAMRGAETEMLEAALRSVRCAAWTELSGIEQARLSLAIARYAIAQLPHSSIPE
ncbi:MAG: hypothetical protein HC840_15235 [Leptolyngbyaceae cyanobacterium RM2_2_4]|nr:hypothetical protein [Leptolyngbyaceae cyanobacterium SM1_4_3]NJN92442.1 hypothetical protein [Leptolyngbyaceae cyanobacterium SL_5_14]NJO50565.1 hypothetical protein [Leptolyngbyaceae cyanobacterium RM2_2_4]